MRVRVCVCVHVCMCTVHAYVWRLDRFRAHAMLPRYRFIKNNLIQTSLIMQSTDLIEQRTDKFSQVQAHNLL